MEAFRKSDLRSATEALAALHARDSLDLPGSAPEFHPEAALWAAKYLYRATQLCLIRSLGPEAIDEYLRTSPRPDSPEAVYSADLCLRFLPDLTRMAKGLAPDDPLVKNLKETAFSWPFSSIGLALEGNPDLTIVLQHPSLRYHYADRIIEKHDRDRLVDPTVSELVRERLGNYAELIWPGLQRQLQ